MLPHPSSRPASRCGLVARRVAKSMLAVLLVGCVLTCVSCVDQGPPIVDTTLLGDGLKVIGYAVVGAAVLGVLGKLVKCPPPMNPYTYIRIFAWIAIVALVCSIFTDFWVPMLVGAVLITLLASLVASPRR